MRDVHGKGLLAAAQGAEVGHIPVQTDQPQQALHELCRLSRRHCRSDQWRSNVDHTEPSRGSARSGLKSVRRTDFRAPFTLHRQAGLDGGVAVVRLSATFAGGLRRPNHVRIEPDRQRSAALERVRHCARTNGASMAHCTRASSASCSSECSVCSSTPAITLDSQDESLTGFVKQCRQMVLQWWF